LIILLNGASSSGKTTIARALQELYPGVLLLFGVDSVVQAAFPPKCDYPPFDQKALRIVNHLVDGQPEVELVFSPFTYPVYRAAVGLYKTLSQQGYDLIVDELLIDDHRIDPYFELLNDEKVYFIAVKPEKAVVVQREKERGDRLPGLAAGLYRAVYNPLFEYDLVIDSGRLSARQSAASIMSLIDSQPDPRGFRHTGRRWQNRPQS